ncbi:DNA-protecting protein DprA [Planococcaceae bacterium Storch 2/2-2]|nr:DNA-protecting protein DprA [Planococcaceae bacterium Storch 2/2-2]
MVKEAFERAEQEPYLNALQEEGIDCIFYHDDAYPSLLKEVYDPPALLYVKGNKTLLHEPIIAIVGSRQATAYTAYALRQFVPPIVQKGYVIVSGVAKGADRMAHEEAIASGGATIGVLGHGYNYCYPKQNEKLMEELAKNHLLVTEYPPFQRPQRWTFPKRNRIIAGVSESVIVTEAEKKSGTMSTVDYALDHGRHIYAIPGAVHATLSRGPNHLIEQGATPLYRQEQIDELF